MRDGASGQWGVVFSDIMYCCPKILSPVDKAVYGLLCTYMDSTTGLTRTDKPWGPSEETLSAKLFCRGVKTVQRSIKKLIEHGAIEPVGDVRTRHYRIRTCLKRPWFYESIGDTHVRNTSGTGDTHVSDSSIAGVVMRTRGETLATSESAISDTHVRLSVSSQDSINSLSDEIQRDDEATLDARERVLIRNEKMDGGNNAPPTDDELYDAGPWRKDKSAFVKALSASLHRIANHYQTEPREWLRLRLQRLVEAKEDRPGWKLSAKNGAAWLRDGAYDLEADEWFAEPRNQAHAITDVIARNEHQMASDRIEARRVLGPGAELLVRHPNAQPSWPLQSGHWPANHLLNARQIRAMLGDDRERAMKLFCRFRDANGDHHYGLKRYWRYTPEGMEYLPWDESGEAQGAAVVDDTARPPENYPTGPSEWKILERDATLDPRGAARLAACRAYQSRTSSMRGDA